MHGRVPALPASWYLAGPSRDVAGARVKTLRLLDDELAIYRGTSGQIHAVHARCTHLGAHLGRGRVAGEVLQCAMHHRVFDPSCDRITPRPGCLRQRVYPVAEQSGAVFVFAGDRPAFELPGAAGAEGEVAVVAGPPQPVTTSWATLVCNAFDIDHMQTVHGRAMREPPLATVVDRHVLELRYVSRVTGTAVSDRIMKALSGDTIRVTIRCWGGTLLTIHSCVGRTVNHLLLCFTPTRDGAIISPFIAVPKGRVPGAATLRAHLSRWLFLTFLRRDLEPLDGMRLNVANALRARGPLGVCAEWLTQLPEASLAHAADVPRTAAELHAARVG